MTSHSLQSPSLLQCNIQHIPVLFCCEVGQLLSLPFFIGKSMLFRKTMIPFGKEKV